MAKTQEAINCSGACPGCGSGKLYIFWHENRIHCEDCGASYYCLKFADLVQFFDRPSPTCSATHWGIADCTVCGLTAEEQADFPAIVPERFRKWQPIETAPKTGVHILAADFSGSVGFGGNPRQSWQDVVHWWQWCDGTHQDEWGWYPSYGPTETALKNLTHWKPLEELGDGVA